MLDKALLKFLGSDKKNIFFITLLQILNLLVTIVFYANVIYVIYLLVEKKFALIVYFIISILILGIFKFLIDKLIGIIQARLGLKIQLSLRKNLFYKILNTHKEIKGFNSVSLTSLQVEGVEQLNLYYTMYLPLFFYAMIAPIILFIIFSFISYQIALILLCCVPLIPISIILVSKYAKKIFNVYWDKYLSMGGKFLDKVKGIKELIINLADLKQQQAMDAEAEEFRKITMKVLIMQLYSTSIMDFVCFAASAIAMVVAVVLLQNNTIPNVYLALFLIVAAIEFFLPLRQLGSAFHISMNGLTAGKKILNIINLKEEESKNLKIEKINSIEFKNVDLGYEDILLKDLSFKLNKIGMYAIVGKSGSGKSTIIKALAKGINPINGQILVNDINLCDLEKYFYENICFVSYQSHLFNSSIRKNFLLVNKDATEDDMLRALNMVQLDDFALDYVFLENANNLSGGQKQRFILAFYLTLNKDVYVFDEVSSNIDNDSEEIIMQIIQKIALNKLVLIVSHRLKNIIKANQILFVNEGKITFIDTHEKLLGKCSEYKKMFNLQKSLEEGIV